MVSARRIPLLVLAAAGLAVPAVASTDLPPGVDAGTATVASSSAATLQARVRPNDDDTTYAFELGTTDAYGYRSAEGSIDKNLTSRLVTARVSGLTAGTTYHFRVVAANRFGATQGPDATFATPGAAGQPASTPAVDPPTAPADTPAADAPGRPVADATAPGAPPAVLPEPAPLVAPPGPALEAVPPAPEIGTAVVVAEAEGVVRWRDRAGREHALEDATAIAPGTVVDTRNGVLELTTAVAGGVQTARFWGGRFEIRQPRGGAGMTELVLRGAMPPCRKAARSSRGRAPRLWGSDSHGRFRTRGKSSVATVRGTKWLTEETCAGTRTRVVEGAVSVRNLRSRKTALVRAGGTYTAR